MTGNQIRRAGGLTLMEVLLSLSIMAILMAAVGAAVTASAQSYQQNRDLFNAVNSARQALVRMTAELRSGQAVDAAGPTTECRFQTADGTQTTYRFLPDSGTLTLTTPAGTFTLCENLSNAVFTKTIGANGLCTGVQILLEVQCGQTRQTLAAAAVIRRNL